MDRTAKNPAFMHRMHHRIARLGTIVVCAMAAALPAYANALDPSTSDPNTILHAVEASQLPARSLARMKMTIRDQTGNRERVFSMRSKRYPDAYKRLMVIEAPADSRDTAFLSVNYKSASRSNEQWVYLPKLHRVSKVANSGNADAFMGSDFTISDLSLTSQDPDKLRLKLVDQSAKVGSEECWIIETAPRTDAMKRESGYERMQIWVSKSKLAVLQFKGWLLGGKKTKYLKASDLRLVNGIWTPQRMNMRTLEGSKLVSETALEFLSVDNASAEVSDSDFTQQRLEQGA